MKILGIESSCDETAAAVVEDGRKELSSVVFSQVPLHRPYGGVVPEIASRSHVEKVGPVVEEAVQRAFGEAAWDKIDAIAVTYGPGLASSLIAGLSAAKGFALALGKPLIAINHMEAHLYSPFLSKDAPQPEECGRMLALAVSGGHTCWVDVPSFGKYEIIGQTLDDAAGEAFDKAAKLLGLGYPGGPEIDRMANLAGRTDAVLFPRGRPKPGSPALGALRAELCVSFSGLKTSLMYYLRNHAPKTEREVAEIAASYREAIVDSIVERTRNALSLREYQTMCVGGGVSLNGYLREKLKALCNEAGVRLLLAEPKYCGDNAAMIAGLAGAGGGIRGATLDMDVNPALEAGD